MNRSTNQDKSSAGRLANMLPWAMPLLTSLLVIGWHLGFLASRPAHLNDIAVELGSVRIFPGAPAASPDGSQVMFYRATKCGCGTFVYDLLTQKERMLTEGTYGQIPLKCSWSPDGKMLAFPGSTNGKVALMIYHSDSGLVETVCNEKLDNFVWLSSASLVYYNYNGGLTRMDKTEKGWSSSCYANEQPVQYSPLTQLVATASNSIAWVNGNMIWEWRFHAESPVKLWEAPTDSTIVEWDYSRETGAFLLRLQDANSHYYLACYSPFHRQFSKIGDLDNANAKNARWINHGKGYAYLVNDLNTHCIRVKIDCADENSSRQIMQNGLGAFTANDDNIYGIANYVIREVVIYNTRSGNVRFISPGKKIMRYAKPGSRLSSSVTNSLGNIHPCEIRLPGSFDPRKKYPLVLHQGMVTLTEAIANANAYYVIVTRPGPEFQHPQLKEWGEDIMAAYRLMAGDPHVDTNQVYLLAASAETVYMSQLMNKEPTLWKGAIMMSPVAFPDLLQSKADRFLINYGDEDQFDTEKQILKFQSNAARLGVPVRVVAAQQAGHTFVSETARTESIKAIMSFLVE